MYKKRTEISAESEAEIHVSETEALIEGLKWIIEGCEDVDAGCSGCHCLCFSTGRSTCNNIRFNVNVH